VTRQSLLKETEMSENQDDEAPRFGAVTDTPDGLDALLHDRPHEWRWAAFASVLIQRRNTLATDVRDHRIGYALPTGERIRYMEELRDLVRECIYDTEALCQQMVEMILASGFMAVFGSRESDEGADADGIVHNANRVMDFYERLLQIAQRARGVSAPSEFLPVLSNAAHVVDKPLGGMDEFIDYYVDVVRLIPSMVLAAEGENLSEPVPLNLHMDNDLLRRIIAQLDELDDAA
jgi:hypothetical protein